MMAKKVGDRRREVASSEGEFGLASLGSHSFECFRPMLSSRWRRP